MHYVGKGGSQEIFIMLPERPGAVLRQLAPGADLSDLEDAVLLTQFAQVGDQQAFAELNCPPGTVSWRLAQALEILRKRLHRRGIVVSGGILTVLQAQIRASRASSTLMTRTSELALAVLHGRESELPSSIRTLTQETLRSMTIAKWKTISLALALALILFGAGFAFSQIRSKQDKAPENDKTVAAVDVRLDLVPSQSEVHLTSEGTFPRKFRFHVVFANRGSKPVKLNLYDLWFNGIGFQIRDPNGKQRSVRPLAQSMKISRTAPRLSKEEFPTLKPGKRFLPKEKSALGQMLSDWLAIRKPGKYRLRAVYDLSTARLKKLDPWDRGCWKGRIVSEEITLIVKSRFGPIVNGLQASLTMSAKQFKLSKPIQIEFTKKNVSQRDLIVWHSGLWPNHKVIVRNAQGKEVALTRFGKLTRKAFSPGGPRDKNIPVTLKPGQSESVVQDLTRLFELSKAGSYTVQMVYEEKQGGWEGRLSSNVVTFSLRR